MDRGGIFRAIVKLTVLCYLPSVLSDAQTPDSESEHRTIQQTMQGVLGLQNTPSQSSEQSWTDSDFDMKMAPKYMLDLYEKYRDGRILSGKQVANTVRSIQAQIGTYQSLISCILL